VQEQLTSEQAYKAMVLFLQEYWERGNRTDEDIAVLLGSMSLLEDGSSADPAMLCDWQSCVARVLRGEADIRLKLNPE
jgi:hypothetical protein